jgi:hypothetical protein
VALIGLSGGRSSVAAGRNHDREELQMTMPSRTRGLIIAGFVLAAGAALLGGSAARSSATPSAKAVRLADATMIVEVNATDGDAGLQVFLDGDPWRSMRISGPAG